MNAPRGAQAAVEVQRCAGGGLWSVRLFLGGEPCAWRTGFGTAAAAEAWGVAQAAPHPVAERILDLAAAAEAWGWAQAAPGADGAGDTLADLRAALAEYETALDDLEEIGQLATRSREVEGGSQGAGLS